MIIITVAEHFTLAPETRKAIDALLASLEDLLPRNASLRFHLKKEGRRLLHGSLSMHARYDDFAYSEVGEDACELAATLKGRLERRLIADKDKRVRSRKRQSHLDRRDPKLEPAGT